MPPIDYYQLLLLKSADCVPSSRRRMSQSGTLPQVKSAFSTVSNSIPRKGLWEDSAGLDLSFPPLLKESKAMCVTKTGVDLTGGNANTLARIIIT
jgi:hypothetical protein